MSALNLPPAATNELNRRVSHGTVLRGVPWDSGVRTRMAGAHGTTGTHGTDRTHRATTGEFGLEPTRGGK